MSKKKRNRNPRNEWWNRQPPKKKNPIDIYREALAKRIRKKNAKSNGTDKTTNNQASDADTPARSAPEQVPVRVSWERLPARLRYGSRNKRSWLYLNADQTYNASQSISLNDLVTNGVDGIDWSMISAAKLILSQTGRGSELFIGEWRGQKGVYKRADKDKYDITEC